MNKHIRVQDVPNLVREEGSKAILSTDIDELNKYRMTRGQRIELAQVVKQQQTMAQELEEIKSLLRQLVGSSR